MMCIIYTGRNPEIRNPFLTSPFPIFRVVYKRAFSKAYAGNFTVHCDGILSRKSWILCYPVETNVYKYFLPWSFCRVIALGNDYSWCNSKDAIGRTKISPHKIFRICCLFSKPNIVQWAAGYDSVSNTWLESRVCCAKICQKRAVRSNTGDCLFQTKVPVRFSKSFQTKFHYTSIWNIIKIN